MRCAMKVQKRSNIDLLGLSEQDVGTIWDGLTLLLQADPPYTRTEYADILRHEIDKELDKIK